MDEMLKESIEILKAQASVRVMREDEISNFLQKVYNGLQESAEHLNSGVEFDKKSIAIDGKKSVKEKSVTCLECGKSFKVITKRHLSTHGLSAAEYREKWGLKMAAPLICKALQRERRNKMKDMKLWERRQKTEDS